MPKYLAKSDNLLMEGSQLKPKAKARQLRLNYWGYLLPVDPWVIADALGVDVEDDPEMETVSARFERVDRRMSIYTNPRESESEQRFAVAHELGHCVLRHGSRFVDTPDEFSDTHFGFLERQANSFALELLIPDFALEALCVRRGITDFESLTNVLGVTEDVLVYKLRKIGWIPRKMNSVPWKRDYNRTVRTFDAHMQRGQRILRRWERTLGRWKG